MHRRPVNARAKVAILPFYPFTFLHFYIFTFSYIPMQDVAPRVVRMADATEAMICTTHLIVSFLVIRFLRF